MLCGTAMVIIASCGMNSPTVPPAGNAPPVDSVRDHASFVSTLRTKRLTVEEIGSVEQPFLQAEGLGLKVSGGNLQAPAELQSFNYDDQSLGTDGVKAAAEDVSQIEPTGQPRTMRIDWIAPPHFFHKERLIVIYVGSDPKTLALLQELLGPQFAGQ